MDYSQKFNNLLKGIAANTQQSAKQKANEKKEEKQETLFDLGQANLKKDELKSDDLYGGMISISSNENKEPAKSPKFNQLWNSIKSKTTVAKNDEAANTSVKADTPLAPMPENAIIDAVVSEKPEKIEIPTQTAEPVPTNAFESQFTGRILGDENVEKATIAYSKLVSVRVGRKYYDYTYKYSFVGNK